MYLVFPSFLDPPGFTFPWWFFSFTFPFEVNFFGVLALGVLVLVCAGWIDFLLFFVSRFAWHHSWWLWMVGLPVLGLKSFFGALFLVLVSLGTYVPCGACSAWLVVFQRFWGCWKVYLQIPLPLPSFYIRWIFLDFSFQGIPWESYSLFSLIIFLFFLPRLGEWEQVGCWWVIVRLFWWAGRLHILGHMEDSWLSCAILHVFQLEVFGYVIAFSGE